MMSLAEIRAINEEVAAHAAKENRVPFVPDRADDVDRWPPFPIPNLGDYLPDGWELTDDQWFVDKTGVGSDHEIALTINQFREALRRHIAENPGDGFAITEEGPCQLYVSAFRRSIHSSAADADDCKNSPCEHGDD